MIKTPETIEELKATVCNNGRVKFCAKVLYCLQYTLNSPQDIQTVGCFWCKDNQSFYTNSITLANFLGLKSNSVNTNFREHGFQLESNSVVTNEHPGLIPRQWKKRRSTICQFTPSSTVSEANDIPLIDQTMPQKYISTTLQAPATPVTNNAPQNDNQFISAFQTNVHPSSKSTSSSFDKLSLVDSAKRLPEETQRLISGSSNEQMQVSIVRLLLSTPLIDSEKDQILSTATSIWLRTIGKSPQCSMLEALQKFLPEDNFNKALCYQLRVNFMFLVNREFAESQIEEQTVSTRSLSFDQFLAFFMRYGSPLDADSCLLSVTDRSNACMISEDDEIPQDYEDPPYFINGFRPTVSKNDVQGFLRTSFKPHPWIIIHSKQPNRFALYTIPRTGKDIVKIYITYNPVADESMRLSVLFGDTIKGAKNWEELLGMLCLNVENGVDVNMDTTRIQTVTAADILPTPEHHVDSYQDVGLDSQSMHGISWSQSGNDMEFGFFLSQLE